MARIPLDDAEAVRSQRGEPTWEIAQLFPRQGEWTVREYLRLPSERHVEYDRGRLEFPPIPTGYHQEVSSSSSRRCEISFARGNSARSMSAGFG